MKKPTGFRVDYRRHRLAAARLRTPPRLFS
jgi:hypothetical protein